MSITVYGAGAIGGLIGASMARGGEDVLLVDKVSAHVDAINARGLRISGFQSFTVPVRACEPRDLRGPLGITFLAVKSQDTEAALDVLAPLAGPHTVVVSLQNGMNPPRIATRLGAQRVVAGFVSFPADWQEPGHIEHGGVGNIWIGELDGRITERLGVIQRLLAHGVGAHVTDNIFGYLSVDLTEELPKIQCPMLVVVPDHDPISSMAQYEVIRDRVPDVTFVVYHGLPHNITDAVPDRCAEDLHRFLIDQRRIPRASPAGPTRRPGGRGT
jgi:pimeloyl-ACP methyl ester carboxylesterase